MGRQASPDIHGGAAMARQKRKLTAAEKRAKRKKREEYQTIFVNGKQKRVKRPPTIDGMDVDEFIRRNADPIWLHQNGMWEYLDNND
jgi:16S rRNA U516 pseudouridylate synthase RsuA-like enzyme